MGMNRYNVSINPSQTSSLLKGLDHKQNRYLWALMNQEPSTDDPSRIHFYQLTADKPETSNIIQKIENKQDGWKTMVVIVSRGKKKWFIWLPPATKEFYKSTKASFSNCKSISCGKANLDGGTGFQYHGGTSVNQQLQGIGNSTCRQHEWGVLMTDSMEEPSAIYRIPKFRMLFLLRSWFYPRGSIEMYLWQLY